MVLGQGLGHELSDSVFQTGGRQLLEQHRPESLVLELVSDDKGHLGIVCPRESLVATNCDQPLPYLDYERQTVHIVNVSKTRYLGGRQLQMSEEEPAVHRMRRQTLMKLFQPLTVVSADGSYVRGRSTLRLDIAFQLARIAATLIR